MNTAFLFCAGLLAGIVAGAAEPVPEKGIASWYGEAHRGKPMANGKPFDPDRFTAASWFYPLGTRVRVTVDSKTHPPRSVLVTITDRGPSRRLVRAGRVIDLARAAFEQLAHPDLGLVPVRVEVADSSRKHASDKKGAAGAAPSEKLTGANYGATVR